MPNIFEIFSQTWLETQRRFFPERYIQGYLHRIEIHQQSFHEIKQDFELLPHNEYLRLTRVKSEVKYETYNYFWVVTMLDRSSYLINPYSYNSANPVLKILHTNEKILLKQQTSPPTFASIQSELREMDFIVYNVKFSRIQLGITIENEEFAMNYFQLARSIV